jgi:hypothetical protein
MQRMKSNIVRGGLNFETAKLVEVFMSLPALLAGNVFAIVERNPTPISS